MHPFDLATHADDFAFLSAEIIFDIRIVPLTMRRWRQYADVLANDFCSRIAKQVFGGMVERFDDPLLVCCDDAIDISPLFRMIYYYFESKYHFVCFGNVTRPFIRQA